MLNKARAVIGLLRFTASFPLPILHTLGTGCGWLLWLLPNTAKRIVAKNLQLCFPELATPARSRLVRYSLCHIAKTALELGPMWLWPGERILAKICTIYGEDAWRAAINDGQGVIVLTPHLAAWELTGLYISKHYPMTALYRPSRAGSELDALILQARERLGGHYVATDSAGVKQLLQAVKSGRIAGILPDQDPGDEGGQFAPFFGHPANTMVLLSRIAIRCQVPVFIAFTERLPFGKGFDLHFAPLPKAISEPPLEHSLTALNQAIEQAIRQIPEQYLWVYKRFKRQPVGMAKVYS